MRKLFGFCVLVLTILIVNLLTDFITSYLMNYKGITNPMKFTAIGMGVLVLILYPAFKFLDKLVTQMAKRAMSKGDNLFGKLIGTFLVFTVLLFVMYCIYAHQWFGMNVPKILISRWF